MDLTEYDEINNVAKLLGHQWIKRTPADKLQVDLEFLAIWFAKYYWGMYYGFRLRQSHNSSSSFFEITLLIQFEICCQIFLKKLSFVHVENELHVSQTLKGFCFYGWHNPNLTCATPCDAIDSNRDNKSKVIVQIWIWYWEYFLIIQRIICACFLFS